MSARMKGSSILKKHREWLDKQYTSGKTRYTVAFLNETWFIHQSVSEMEETETISKDISEHFKKMGFVVTPKGIGWKISLAA